MDNKDLVACPCGSTEYKEIFKGVYNRLYVRDYNFKILKCRHCGLVRSYPVPSVENILKKAEYSMSKNLSDYEKGAFWIQPIIDNMKKLKKEGTFLDIGCFTGKTLEVAEKKGFTAYGVDIYKPACEFGIKLGRKIFCGEIYDAQLEDNFFDIILLNHVFEHVFEPSKMIRELNRILAPDGYIVINVPCYKSIMRVLMGENWMTWSPHMHVYYYTRETLNNIITKNSCLRPVYIHQKGRLEPPGKGVISSFIKTAIAKFASLVNKGEQIEALYKKP